MFYTCQYCYYKHPTPFLKCTNCQIDGSKVLRFLCICGKYEIVLYKEPLHKKHYVLFDIDQPFLAEHLKTCEFINCLRNFRLPYPDFIFHLSNNIFYASHLNRFRWDNRLPESDYPLILLPQSISENDIEPCKTCDLKILTSVKNPDLEAVGYNDLTLLTLKLLHAQICGGLNEKIKRSTPQASKPCTGAAASKASSKGYIQASFTFPCCNEVKIIEAGRKTKAIWRHLYGDSYKSQNPMNIVQPHKTDCMKKYPFICLCGRIIPYIFSIDNSKPSMPAYLYDDAEINSSIQPLRRHQSDCLSKATINTKMLKDLYAEHILAQSHKDEGLGSDSRRGSGIVHRWHSVLITAGNEETCKRKTERIIKSGGYPSLYPLLPNPYYDWPTSPFKDIVEHRCPKCSLHIFKTMSVNDQDFIIKNHICDIFKNIVTKTTI